MRISSFQADVAVAVMLNSPYDTRSKSILTGKLMLWFDYFTQSSSDFVEKWSVFPLLFVFIFNKEVKLLLVTLAVATQLSSVQFSSAQFSSAAQLTSAQLSAFETGRYNKAAVWQSAGETNIVEKVGGIIIFICFALRRWRQSVWDTSKSFQNVFVHIVANSLFGKCLRRRQITVHRFPRIEYLWKGQVYWRKGWRQSIWDTINKLFAEFICYSNERRLFNKFTLLFAVCNYSAGNEPKICKDGAVGLSRRRSAGSY